MKTKTEFEIADQNGRELFKHYCKQQSWCTIKKESKDEYASWDISYYSGSTLIIGEVKVREYNSTAFSDWEYEQKKHNGLLEVYQQTKVKHPNKKIEIQYINIFQNQAVKIWTTTNIHNQQQPQTKLRPATTLGTTTLKPKQVYYCNLKNESNRGLLNSLKFNIRPDEDDDDMLPF